jgi:hypothetical protein
MLGPWFGTANVTDMPRVDFLGIGALKAATTTLHVLLAAHPQICFPRHVKEVSFFDRHYQRGSDWYHGLFEPGPGQFCGEITPNYIYEPACPSRIAALLPQVKMILLLRDPVRRIYSQYTHFRQQSYYRGDFATYLSEHPNALERSLYHRQLQRYWDHFPREQIRIVLFETFVAQPEATIAEVCRFIGVDDRFRPPPKRSAPSTVPRLPWLYGLGSRTMTRLYDWQLTPVIAAIKRTGIQRWMLSRRVDRSVFPPMGEVERRQLVSRIEPDLAALEAALGFDLRQVWDLGAPLAAGRPGSDVVRFAGSTEEGIPAR